MPRRSHVRIGLIGPSSAGKTNLFRTIHESLDRGRHGFPRAVDPQIRHEFDRPAVDGLSPEEILERYVVMPGDRTAERDASTVLSGKMAGTPTDQIITRHFSLSYNDIRRPQSHRIALTITDAAGEHSFPPGGVLGELKAVRLELYRELRGCHGIIVVVPFSSATQVEFVNRLAAWMGGIQRAAQKAGDEVESREKNIRSEDEPNLPRRWVIALTRYDALFTDFGSSALKLAADPAVANHIINRLVQNVRNGTGYKNDIAKFDAAYGGPYEIVFMPTSSFGFVPGFGCVNLDPGVPDEDALSQIEGGRSPGPFQVVIPNYPGQSLFPFLTADPFIYAATDLSNDFAVPLDAALDQTSFENRMAKADPRSFSPKETVSVSQETNQPVFGAKPSPDREESWRRKAARMFRKFDIDL